MDFLLFIFLPQAVDPVVMVVLGATHIVQDSGVLYLPQAVDPVVMVVLGATHIVQDSGPSSGLIQPFIQGEQLVPSTSSPAAQTTMENMSICC